ncbi:hypothetical protein A1342_07630 [Methylomonas methanica]|uniref:Ice-binding protein C-terminal domain-containing protein n=2 Tax=Methylomonas TaxID=416 RepID=A0A126T196_9GAMM|nr:hypothetical protein JT25_005015 [Methylomonas denitrificans]OAH98606.1 hypothetical protein A1342_07630 [Methylomonas methanica]
MVKKMNKLKTLGMALALASAPVVTNATAIQLLNTDAGGSFVTLDKLNITSTTPVYTTTVNVGADNILSNGDVFTESINFIVNSSSLTGFPLNFDLAGDYLFSASLSGTVQNLTGTGITLNADNSLSGVATTFFDVAFNAAVNNILLQNLDIPANVANLSVVSGGSSSIQLVAGTLLGDITINALVNTAPGQLYQTSGTPYLRDSLGNILTTDLLTITTGSARVCNSSIASCTTQTGLTGNFAAKTIDIEFFDNQAAQTYSQVPEPASLALLGIGLLGMSGFKRSKLSA